MKAISLGVTSVLLALCAATGCKRSALNHEDAGRVDSRAAVATNAPFANLTATNNAPVTYWTSYLLFRDINRQGQQTESGYPEVYRSIEEANTYQATVRDIRARAPKQIVVLGTNAIPYLLARLGEPTLPNDMSRRRTDPATGVQIEDSGRVRRGQAAEGLTLLANHTNLIVPELQAMLENTNMTAEVRGAARWTLDQILKPRIVPMFPEKDSVQ